MKTKEQIIKEITRKYEVVGEYTEILLSMGKIPVDNKEELKRYKDAKKMIDAINAQIEILGWVLE